MSWQFLHVTRRTYKSSDRWGTLFIRSADNKSWEKYCSTYELPWITDKKGRSKSSKSRIRIGKYDLKVRTDGAKGWRLELLGTGHRSYIQVHRAHKSMYIEGCILPVHFSDLRASGLKKGEQIIQTKSVALMKGIRKRYEALKEGKSGNPTLEITALLPPMVPVKSDTAFA